MRSHIFSRRGALKSMASAAVATLGGISFPAILKAEDVIKVGFIGPISGFYALQGNDMLHSAQMAVDTINETNAAGGRKLVLIAEDDKLEAKAAIDAARKLVFQDKVDVIIGVLASHTRVAALSVTEPAKTLFIYPTFYEGGECKKYLVCTGTVPNQSVDPAVPWLMKNVGKRVYVIGNDFQYPRGMAELIKTAADRNGGSYVGEEFYPFGTAEYQAIFQRVRDANPDILWVMDAGQPLMIQQYRQFEMKPQIISTIMHENWTTQTQGAAEGILANSSYFATVGSPANEKFLKEYFRRFGDSYYPTSFGESQYDSVWLYAKAVAKAGSADKDKVIKALAEVSFDAPQGHINVLASNQHARVNSVLTRVDKVGKMEVVERFGQVDPVVPGCKLS
jgi:urea transport system substrate-binding protein